jgi:DNA-binding MarR family transcriptional regulator
MNVDTSTVSRQLTALEESGWVARDRDPADARAHLLHITAAGRRVLERSWARRREALQLVLAGWSDDDLRRLAEHLERFNHDMATFRAAGHRSAGQETT